MKRAALLLALLLPLAVALALAAPGRALHGRIARIVRAYGDPAKVEAVRAYRVEGELFVALRHESVPTTRVFARPDRFKTMIDYEGGIEARIVDGHEGWRMVAGGPLQEASGAMLFSMVLQAARCGVPWILLERETSTRSIAPRLENGVQLEGIEFDLGDGLVLRVWTNPRTHLVEVSQTAFRTPGSLAHFETFYSDFREVEGVKFAFHEENFASGVQTGVTTVKRLVVNPPLSPTEFTPPAPPDSAGARGGGRTHG